jgi:glycine oxidase
MNCVVVGGGIIGLSVANELASSGLTTTIVEVGKLGAEASSAAAGMLAAQLEAHSPGPFLDLCLYSRKLYPRWLKGLEESTGCSAELIKSGSLQAAFTESEAERLRGIVSWQNEQGLAAEFVTGAALRKLEPALSHGALGAAYCPEDCQLDALKLMRILTIAAAKSGVSFRAGHVTSVLERDGRAVGVSIEGDRLEADAVVLAAGAWSSLIDRSLPGVRVRPVRGQMIELDLQVPIFTKLLKSASGYVVPRRNGRVLAGSTMETVGFDKKVTADGVHRILGTALQLVPGLAQAELVATWAGFRPATEDRLPLIGKGHLERLFVATGHLRNGILLAPATAELVGQLVRNEAQSIELHPFRFGR